MCWARSQTFAPSTMCDSLSIGVAVLQLLTMHARLLMRSALSTKPKRAGATSGCLCGTVTPCADGVHGVETWAWRRQRQHSTEPVQRAHTSGAFGAGKLTSARVTARNRRGTCLTACFAGAILREHAAIASFRPHLPVKLASESHQPASTTHLRPLNAVCARGLGVEVLQEQASAMLGVSVRSGLSHWSQNVESCCGRRACFDQVLLPVRGGLRATPVHPKQALLEKAREEQQQQLL